MTAECADRLDLPPMVAGLRERAEYTVSVDAGQGISTGISARTER